MMPILDATHDPSRRSWVESANGHPDFPIQNLPFGVFSPRGEGARGGVAIGDSILDLSRVLEAGLLSGGAAKVAEAASGSTLNALLTLGRGPRQTLRALLSDLLSAGYADVAGVRSCLRSSTESTMHLPASIGDYTDFYVGIHHATNVGKLFRPDNPLMPNYKYVPIGYHGRASSICTSGEPVRRPTGQIKTPDAEPSVRPSEQLDFELEVGLWIGPGNDLGVPVSIGEAADHIAGYCLLNDWSARDIQAWEYQPLGPFLSKSFSSTISPWIVTPEALAPFRAAQADRPAGDPAPLPYLWNAADQEEGAFDLTLDVLLLTPGLRSQARPPHLLTRSNTRHMYWTAAQMLTHHTSNGCNLRPGDLLGSGTISGPDPGGFGSLLEITMGGKQPVTLASGETRRFIEDGDEVILTARAQRPGAVAIGFGECRGILSPASNAPRA